MISNEIITKPACKAVAFIPTKNCWRRGTDAFSLRILMSVNHNITLA